MFSMRKLFQATAVRVHRYKNVKKYSTATASGDDKPYPLDGIRVLDLTRIGKIVFEINYFFLINLIEYKPNKFILIKINSCWTILYNDFIGFGC